MFEKTLPRNLKKVLYAHLVCDEYKFQQELKSFKFKLNLRLNKCIAMTLSDLSKLKRHMSGLFPTQCFYQSPLY